VNLFRGQKVKVARSRNACDRCWPIHRERNVLEIPKLVGRLPTTRAIIRTNSSDCTVLTATGLVKGEWQIMNQYRIETHEPIDIKFGVYNYVHPIPNLVQIHPRELLGK